MAEYYNVTTNLGDAEIANAIATNTKLNITHIAFGDGNGSVPIPNKARTSLVREDHRQAVTKYERHATNANWIVIETIIPSSIGGFWVREMGIIANGKLISHGSHAPFEKVADPSGVSEYRLRFTQNVTDGSVVEITLDESLIYASQAWVEENFIKRSEIVDNLITADPNKPLSANAGKSLQDGKLGKNDNAATATKLATIRSLSFSGDASGTMSFDGSANVSTNLTLSNTGVVAGTYKSVTVDAKGRISAGNDVITGLVTATTATGTANQATSNTNTFLNITEKIGSATTTVGTSTQVTGAGTVSVTSDTTGKITITGAQSITGNAATATELQTARTIAISGAVTGTATSFNGSGNIAIATTAIDGSKISTGTIPAARIPAASTIAAGAVKLNNTLTSTSTTEAATANTVKLLNDRFTDDFLNLKSENGYQKLPSGLIIQWGRFTPTMATTVGSPQYVSYPIAFPNKLLFAVPSTNGGATSGTELAHIDTSLSTKTQLGIYTNYNNSDCWYFAVGY